MDFLRILIFTSAIVVLPHLADAGCVQDTFKNKEFVQCVTGFNLITNAIDSMDPFDYDAAMSVMCRWSSRGGRKRIVLPPLSSLETKRNRKGDKLRYKHFKNKNMKPAAVTEAKATIGCVLDYIKTCPDLITPGDTVAMLQGLDYVEEIGGIEAHCSMVSGSCTAVKECINKPRIGWNTEHETTPSASFIPFMGIQPSIKIICGPLKGIFNCMKDVGDVCKGFEDYIKKLMDLRRIGLSPGIIIPTYEQTKAFVKTECANISKDFATSTCVKNALESELFKKCFANVSTNYPVQEGKFTCEQVRASHKCASMTIGKNCGPEYTNVFVKLSPVFVAGMSKKCKLETSGSTSGSTSVSSGSTSASTSGSRVIHMSSFAIFAALSLALTLM